MDPRLKEIGSALGRMIHGYQALGLLAAAAELDLWTELRDGPKTVAELASSSGCSDAQLQRLLAGLVMIGVIRREPGQGGDSPSETAQEATYQMTDLGQAASDPRLPFADQITLAVGEYAPAWLHLGKGLRARAIPFDHAFGRSVWQHRAEKARLGAAFDRVMARVQLQNRFFVLEQCDLSSSRVLVDVGGGAGLLCAALLQKHRHLTGVVFDQPQLAATAEATLRKYQLEDRCRFSAGDFFDSVPRGDALLLQHILHDWGDDACVEILTNCRAALPSGGRLFIVERLVGQTPSSPSGGPANEPANERSARQDPGDILRDLHMLCLTGGQERTEEEYRALLQRCGFDTVRSVVSGTGADLLEARAR